LYFTWLSYDFVFNKMNLFWKSQTTGIPMKYFFMVFPIAFSLMSVRILWNNYLVWFKHEDIADPESLELEKMQHDAKMAKAGGA